MDTEVQIFVVRTTKTGIRTSQTGRVLPPSFSRRRSCFTGKHLGRSAIGKGSAENFPSLHSALNLTFLCDAGHNT